VKTNEIFKGSPVGEKGLLLSSQIAQLAIDRGYKGDLVYN